MNLLPPMFDFFEFMKSSKVPAKKLLAKNTQAGDKARFFFSVNLELPTDKHVTLDKVHSTMTVKQLKLQIENVTGIPGYSIDLCALPGQYHLCRVNYDPHSYLQRLRYLDDYDMEDNSRLSFFHVVPGATIKVLLWPEWKSLIKASTVGDYYGVLACGIRDPVKVSKLRETKEFNEKATVALYVASHQGHVFTVSRLVDAGVDPCKVLPSGKSPIHVAVERQHVTCVSILIGLSQGLETQKSHDDNNAIRKSTFTSVATLLKKKRGWKKIVQQRDQRKKRKEDKTKLPFVPRREFQKCDSAFPTHITGTLGRIYQCNLLETESRFVKKRYDTPWH